MDIKLKNLCEKIINEYNFKDPEPDYKQNLIDDAIEDIQKAKKHNMVDSPFYSLESKLEFWKKELALHKISNEEIERVISYALYDRSTNLESKTFSKFDLQDYTEIIYEGKSGHGDQKIVINAMKDAIKQGLITVKDTKSGWIVRATKGDLQEAIHKGEKAYHYLRRFLEKIKSFEEFYLSEMALSNLQKIGQWDNKKNRHGYDKQSIGILSSPSGLKKIEQKFNRIGNWDFNLYFLKNTNAWKENEVGMVTPQELERKLGLTIGKDFPTPGERDITIMFVGNAAAERVPLTPWTIAHRIGHSFAATFLKKYNDQSIKQYKKKINNSLIGLLKAYGVNIDNNRRADILGVIFSNDYVVRNLLESIGKFRSARMKKLPRTGEFIYECFAQYLLSDGELSFNDLPRFLKSSNKKAWGKETGGTYRLQDEEAANEYLQQLIISFEQLFDYYLGSHIETISIM